MLHILAAWWLAEAGFASEACQVLARVGPAMGEAASGYWARFLKAALEGEVQQALALAMPDMEQAMRRNEFTARTMAQGYALMRRPDEALRWLRVSIDGGFINYPYLVEHDPFLDTLRGDRRFRQLMDEVKPRWEAVVAWERSR